MGESIQGLLWKQKVGVLGVRWKKNWVYADSRFFLQWEGKERPEEDDVPKYEYYMIDCEARSVPTNKKFSFQITDKSKNKSMIFAADDHQSFLRWMQVLTQSPDTGESAESSVADSERPSVDFREIAAKARSSPDKKNGSREDLSSGQEERIAAIFIKIASKTNSDANALHWSQFAQFVHAIEPQLNADRVEVLFRRYCPLAASGDLFNKDQVIAFWKHCSFLLHPTTTNAWTSFESTAFLSTDEHDAASAANLDDQSVLALRCEDKYSTAFCAMQLRIPIPNTDELSSILLSPPTSNHGFGSHAIEECSHKVYPLIAQHQNDLHNKLTKLATKSRQLQRHGDDESLRLAVRQLEADALRCMVFLADIYGHFRSNAVTGTQRLIDELCLPQKMQTLSPLVLDQSMTVWEFRGVCLRLLTTPILEEDADSSAEREKEVLAKDEVNAKMAANQWRSNQYLNGTADALLTRTSLLDALLSSKRGSSHDTHSPAAPEDAINLHEFAKQFCIRNKLSMIVDYCGFRVLAYVPTTHLCTESIVQLSGERHGEHRQSDEAAAAPEQEHKLDDSFYANLQSELHLLGGLNDCQQCVWTTRVNEKEFNMAGMYLQGTMSLPADLPRSQTHDLLTKQLRPEFVQFHREFYGDEQLLKSADSLRIASSERRQAHHTTDNSIDDPSSKKNQEANTISDEEPEEVLDENASVIPLSAEDEQWMAAVNYLYEEHIPEFVAQLDSFQYIPFDSLSLTQCMHSFGINMRHLGAVYSLSRNHLVKQLVFAEMVARACKTLVASALRLFMRKCKGLSIRAECLDRSRERDYRELMTECHREREVIIMDVFQRLFPVEGEVASTTPSVMKAKEDFFVVLLDIIYRKFGLFVKKEDDIFASYSMCPSQLFTAMQVHLSVRFKESAIQRIHPIKGVMQTPLSPRDVVSFLLPKTKHSRDMLAGIFAFGGDMRNMLSLRKSYLSSKLFRDAVALHELSYALLSKSILAPQRFSIEFNEERAESSAPSALEMDVTLTSQQHLSWRELEEMAIAVHDLAVALLLSKQWKTCGDVIRQHLADVRTQQISISTARLLVVLQICEFRRGEITRAVVCYDAASQMFQQLLPTGHPLCAIPASTMSDLYLSTAAKLSPNICLSIPIPMRIVAATKLILRGGQGNQRSALLSESEEFTANELQSAAGIHAARVFMQIALSIWNANIPLLAVPNITEKEREQFLQQQSQQQEDDLFLTATNRDAFALSTFAGCAVQQKLGALCVLSGQYAQAIALLTPVTIVLEDWLASATTETSKSIARKALVFALFRLAWAYYHVMNDDATDHNREGSTMLSEAAQQKREDQQHAQAVRCGTRALAIWQALDTSLHHAHVAADSHQPRQTRVHDAYAQISLRLMLFDIFSLRNEHDFALDMLQGAWVLLRNATMKHGEHERIVASQLVTLSQVASKSAELAFAALPMPARSLVESVSADWHAEVEQLHSLELQHHQTRIGWAQMTQSGELWRIASQVLIDVLWSGQIASYLAELVMETQRATAEDDKGRFSVSADVKNERLDHQKLLSVSNDNETRDILRKLVLSLPVHVQAAALYCLVQSPLEFASLLLAGP